MIGGYNSTTGYLNTVERSSGSGTSSWSTVASMPTNRAYLAAAVVGDKIYAIGSRVGSIVLNVVERYDPANNSWTAVAPMPTARYGLAVAVANRKIYAIGGIGSNGQPLNVVEEYDPLTNTWTTKAPMLTARRHLAAATVDDVIYAIGGYNNGYLNTVEAFDFRTTLYVHHKD